MVTISSVNGNVGLWDKTADACLVATPGMKLQEDHLWVIATGPASSAHLNINGKPFDLPPKSQMTIQASENGILEWINKQRPYSRHTRNWAGSVKLLVGKIWQAAGGETQDDQTGNVAVGVRG